MSPVDLLELIRRGSDPKPRGRRGWPDSDGLATSQELGSLPEDRGLQSQSFERCVPVLKTFIFNSQPRSNRTLAVTCRNVKPDPKSPAPERRLEHLIFWDLRLQKKSETQNPQQESELDQPCGEGFTGPPSSDFHGSVNLRGSERPGRSD